MLSGRSLVRNDAREIECRTGDDRLAVVHRHPAAAVRYHDRTGIGDVKAAGTPLGEEFQREFEHVAFLGVVGLAAVERKAPERMIRQALGVVGKHGNDAPLRGRRYLEITHLRAVAVDDDFLGLELILRQTSRCAPFDPLRVLRERKAPFCDGAAAIAILERRLATGEQPLAGRAKLEADAISRRGSLADGDRFCPVDGKARRDSVERVRKPHRAPALEG